MGAFAVLLAVLVSSTSAVMVLPQAWVPPAQLHKLVVGDPPAATCVTSKHRFCQKSFNDDLGITSLVDWRNSSIFIADVVGIMSQSVDGLLRVCSARTQFFRCLSTSYSSCISLFNFLKMGFSYQEAITFLTIFRELDFTCNGGLLQMIQHHKCLTTLPEAVTQEIVKCQQQFQEAVNNDPDSICTAAETMLLCVSAPMEPVCGRDSAWFQCEQNRLSLDIDSYCTHLTCMYSTSQVVRDQSTNSRHALVKGENPFFMKREKQFLFAYLGARAEERMKRRKREIEEGASE